MAPGEMIESEDIGNRKTNVVIAHLTVFEVAIHYRGMFESKFEELSHVRQA